VVTTSTSLAALAMPFFLTRPATSSAVTTTACPFAIFSLISAIVFVIFRSSQSGSCAPNS
jgi:hypothetical protein